MAFKSHQIPCPAGVATPLVVKGDGTGTTFTTVGGSNGDPTPFSYKNIDPTITIWVGGADVTTANGYPIYAMSSIPSTLIEAGEILYAVGDTGSPVMAVIGMRQNV